MKEFEYHGIWWTPDKDEQKVPGILTFSNDKGLILKTFMASEHLTQNSFASDSSPSYEVILGATNKTRITLCNCTTISLGDFCGLDVVHTNEYSADLAFIGNHFLEGLSATKFSRLWVDYTYLSNWASLSQYDIITEKYPNPNCHDFSIEFREADDIHLNILNFRLKILQRVSYDLKEHQASQRISSSIEFNLEEAVIFDDLHQNHLLPFKHFLTFVTNEINYVTQLLVWTDNDIKGTEVIFRESIFESKNYSPSLRKMIFTAQEVEDKIEQVLGAWFDIYETNRDIINLFISTKNQYLYGENKILFLAQVFEGFYHKNRLNSDKSEIAFETTVLDIFKENHRIIEEILKIILQPLNEKCKKKVVERFTKNLVEKIKTARHYYSHYHNETESRKLFSNHEQLFRITQIMTFLFKGSLLRKMKFDEEFIVDKINKDSDFKYLQGNIDKYSLFSK